MSGVGGEAGGVREARRKHRNRRRSRGDESAGTEGESSSKIEIGAPYNNNIMGLKIHNIMSYKHAQSVNVRVTTGMLFY